jgi:hypothetical protein
LATPVSVIGVEQPQDYVAGADRPARRAEHELMGVAMLLEPDIEADNGIIHGIDLGRHTRSRPESTSPFSLHPEK